MWGLLSNSTPTSLMEFNFWRTSVKRFALCYQTVVLSALTVCPVCDVGVLWPNGWMNLGVHVCLGPGHIVLNGDPVPLPQRGQSPRQFSAHICCGQMAGWIKMPLGMEVGLGPGDCVIIYYYYCISSAGARTKCLCITLALQ